MKSHASKQASTTKLTTLIRLQPQNWHLKSRFQLTKLTSQEQVSTTELTFQDTLQPTKLTSQQQVSTTELTFQDTFQPTKLTSQKQVSTNKADISTAGFNHRAHFSRHASTNTADISRAGFTACGAAVAAHSLVDVPLRLQVVVPAGGVVPPGAAPGRQEAGAEAQQQREDGHQHRRQCQLLPGVEGRGVKGRGLLVHRATWGGPKRRGSFFFSYISHAQPILVSLGAR